VIFKLSKAIFKLMKANTVDKLDCYVGTYIGQENTNKIEQCTISLRTKEVFE